MKNEIKIEKGVPMPKADACRIRYPLGELKIEDSFFVPAKSKRKEDITSLQRNMGSLIAQWRRNNDLTRKFATRRTEDGVRVWRIQ